MSAMATYPDLSGQHVFITGAARGLGRSMAEKEVYLGVQVQTRRMVDRAVERAAPLLRRIFPDAVDAELVALDSEVEHLDQVIGSPGLDGRPVYAEEMFWRPAGSHVYMQDMTGPGWRDVPSIMESLKHLNELRLRSSRETLVAGPAAG